MFCGPSETFYTTVVSNSKYCSMKVQLMKTKCEILGKHWLVHSRKTVSLFFSICTCFFTFSRSACCCTELALFQRECDHMQKVARPQERVRSPWAQQNQGLRQKPVHEAGRWRCGGGINSQWMDAARCFFPWEHQWTLACSPRVCIGSYLHSDSSFHPQNKQFTLDSLMPAVIGSTPSIQPWDGAAAEELDEWMDLPAFSDLVYPESFIKVDFILPPDALFFPL